MNIEIHKPELERRVREGTALYRSLQGWLAPTEAQNPAEQHPVKDSGVRLAGAGDVSV